jgi:hypothetical protein
MALSVCAVFLGLQRLEGRHSCCLIRVWLTALKIVCRCQWVPTFLTRSRFEALFFYCACIGGLRPPPAQAPVKSLTRCACRASPRASPLRDTARDATFLVVDGF